MSSLFCYVQRSEVGDLGNEPKRNHHHHHRHHRDREGSGEKRHHHHKLRGSDRADSSSSKRQRSRDSGNSRGGGRSSSFKRHQRTSAKQNPPKSSACVIIWQCTAGTRQCWYRAGSSREQWRNFKFRVPARKSFRAPLSFLFSCFHVFSFSALISCPFFFIFVFFLSLRFLRLQVVPLHAANRSGKTYFRVLWHPINRIQWH